MRCVCLGCGSEFEECEIENAYGMCDYSVATILEDGAEPCCPYCGSQDIITKREEDYR